MAKNRVLIVDDDLTLLEFLKDALSVMGYAVRVANAQVDALGAIKQEKPDIIMLDVNMPGTDGILFCRDIRRSPETSDIPVVIMTASVDNATYKEAMLFGATDFMPKPFEIAQMDKMIRECLEKSRAKRGDHQ